MYQDLFLAAKKKPLSYQWQQKNLYKQVNNWHSLSYTYNDERERGKERNKWKIFQWAAQNWSRSGVIRNNTAWCQDLKHASSYIRPPANCGFM